MNREHVEKTAPLLSRTITRWGRENFRGYPWREPGKHWLALVAEVMLQRTRASSVVPVWTLFRERFPDLESAASAETEEFRSILRPLGLNWRTDRLKHLIEIIHRQKGVPVTKKELLQLPAVGEYVASAFMSLHAGKRAVIVDANVVRWICRMIGESYDGETRRQQWLIDLADLLTPERVFRDYNYGLLDLTMTLCVNNPQCSLCPVMRHCAYGGRKT